MANSDIYVLAMTIFGFLAGGYINALALIIPRRLTDEWGQQCAELRNEEYSLGANDAFWWIVCNKCEHTFRPSFLGWLLLDHCRRCGTTLSAHFIYVSLVTAAAAAFVSSLFGAGVTGLAATFLVISLVLLARISRTALLLPDLIVFPLMFAGLALNSVGTFVGPSQSIWGVFAGYFPLWTIYWIAKLTMQKDILGHGIFKTFAAVGAWLGWQHVLIAQLLFIVIKTLQMYIEGHLVLNKKEGPLPSGESIALATLILLASGVRTGAWG